MGFGLDPVVLQQLGPLIQQAFGVQQDQALDPMSQAASQAQQDALKAQQVFTNAAAQPAPQYNGSLDQLAGNVGSVLSGNPVYSQQAHQRTEGRQNDLMQARRENLLGLQEIYKQKADAAEKLGNSLMAEKARVSLERVNRQMKQMDDEAAFQRTTEQTKQKQGFEAQQKALDRQNELEKARIIASRPSAGAMGPGSGFDPAAVAAGILDGSVPPDSRGFSRGQWGAIVGQIRKANPQFNLTKATSDWTGVSQFVKTLNQGQQVQLRQRAQNAATTADFIDQLIGEIKSKAPARTPVTVLNKVQLGAIKNGAWGPEAADAATRLEAQIAAWRLEMAAVYSGGYAPQEQHLKEANSLIDPNWALNRIEAGLQIGRRDTNIRLNAVNQMGPTTPSNPVVPGGTGTGSVNIGPNQMPFDQGSADSFSVKAPNGKTYHFKTQESANAFKKRAGIE